MKISKILMVDDDPGIRKVAEITLSRLGQWQVAVADSGLKALEIVVDFMPDVILLDVMMPGLDGPSTFKKLKENNRTADIPVIFLTAKVQRQEVQKYEQLGAEGVITKPFDPLTLAGEIRRILDPVMSVACTD